MIAEQRKMNLKLPDIEFGLIGGAVCSPKLLQDARLALNIKKIKSIYGLTEGTAANILSLPDEDPKLVEKFAGIVGDHIEAKVIDKDGNAVPFGQPGELCLRGYCTMLGYYGDEAKTKEILDKDKWSGLKDFR